MLFDLGKHGIPPDLSYLRQHEDEPCPDEIGIDNAQTLSKKSESIMGKKSEAMRSVASTAEAMRSIGSIGMSRDLAERFVAAKEMARVRELRLRMPTVIGGFSIFFIGLALGNSRLFKDWPWFVALTWLQNLGIILGSLGLLPSDRRAIPLFVKLVIIPVFILLLLIAVMHLPKLRLVLRETKCEHFEEEIPCWFKFCIIARSGVGACSCIVGIARNAFALKAKASSRVLLLIYFSTVGWVLFCTGATSIINAAIALLVGSPSISFAFFGQDVSYCTVACMMLFGHDFRIRSQAWFMSRSETSITAAGVAQLLGAQSIDKLLVTARATFKFVRADRMTYYDMESNCPNPDLVACTDKGHLGSVDAFVSHSWHDDPSLKWASLQKFREEFKRRESREPKLWIDKYSIDQTNLEQSLSCLPVYLAGCKEFRILCGSTYLDRLWCIVEIYVFIQMGGLRSNLHVELLGDSETMLALGSQFDPRKAQCFSQEDTERLHAVIEITGYREITQLVNDVFFQCANPESFELEVAEIELAV